MQKAILCDISDVGETKDVRPSGTTFSSVRQHTVLFPFDSLNYSPVGNRDWKVQIAKLLDATNAYTKQGIVVLTPNTYVDAYACAPKLGITKHGFLQSNWAVKPVIQTVDDQPTKDLALMRIRRRLASHFGRTNVAVPLAELGDLRRTIVSMVKPTKWFLHRYTKVRKARRTNADNKLRDCQDLWLSYSFGIKPMMQDARDLASAVATFMAKPRHMQVVSGAAEKTWRTSTKFSGYGGVPGMTARDFTLSYNHSIKYVYKAGVNLAALAGNNYDLSDVLLPELSLRSFASTAWELLPYSWLIDYFTTIGAYLDDTFEVDSGNTVYLVCSRLYTCEVDEQFIHRSTLSSDFRNEISGTSSGWNLFVNYFDFNRAKVASLPHPSLRFKTADEMGINAVSKLLNLAALLGRS